MPRVPFESLPDDARLWVFPATEPLAGSELQHLLGVVDGFLADWRAHGQPLTVGRDWREGRFLLVAVDVHSEPPSGCSIDAFMRVLKDLEARAGIGLTDHGRVLYRTQGGPIASATRPDFARMAREGSVTLETPVFDTTLTRLQALREGRFEVPAGQAWHGRAFFRDRAPS